jgi:hypothetical protein
MKASRIWWCKRRCQFRARVVLACRACVDPPSDPDLEHRRNPTMFCFDPFCPLASLWRRNLCFTAPHAKPLFRGNISSNTFRKAQILDVSSWTMTYSTRSCRWATNPPQKLTNHHLYNNGMLMSPQPMAQEMRILVLYLWSLSSSIHSVIDLATMPILMIMTR